MSPRHRDFVADLWKCGSRLDLFFLVLWPSIFFTAPPSMSSGRTYEHFSKNLVRCIYEVTFFVYSSFHQSHALGYLPCLYTRADGESWAISLKFTTAAFAVKIAQPGCANSGAHRAVVQRIIGWQRCTGFLAILARQGPNQLLRGAIVIRTHDVPKNPYIPLFLHTILGPDYYVLP